MDNPIILIAVGTLVGLVIGYVIAKTLEKNNASKLIKDAKKSAASVLKEAKIEGESIKKDKILQAKERFIELKSEHEKVILSRDGNHFNPKLIIAIKVINKITDEKSKTSSKILAQSCMTI